GSISSPLWGRTKVGGRSPRHGACPVRSPRPCAGSPPTLTLPHKGGREIATTSAGVHALCNIIFSIPQPWAGSGWPLGACKSRNSKTRQRGFRRRNPPLARRFGKTPRWRVGLVLSATHSLGQVAALGSLKQVVVQCGLSRLWMPILGLLLVPACC